MAVSIMMNRGLSLRKALKYAGSSSENYYYKPRRKASRLDDQSVMEHIRELALQRPLYGSRRIAAMLSRRLGRRINRKQVQHAFRLMGWTKPQTTKKELIRSTRKRPPKPTDINQQWQTDITYVWCELDGWCYLFNVLDVYSREWIAYVFDTMAVAGNAIQSVVKAVEKYPEAAGRVILRCDNGPQYKSGAFRESMKALGLHMEFIAASTPEQNGHIESFHGKFKREYVWPQEFATFQEAEAAIREAFVDYNGVRPHSSLKYMTPYEFVAKLKEKEEMAK
jgi:transposase InsO family protein